MGLRRIEHAGAVVHRIDLIAIGEKIIGHGETGAATSCCPSPSAWLTAFSMR
jgi:hypothetical protein